VPAARAEVSYTPPQLGAIYNFPPATDGAGRTIAIIELGGGFSTGDLDRYFSSLGLKRPSVQAVGVDRAQNSPGHDPNGVDGEVLLDIEVVGALAPQASIVVYFAPNTDAGFLDAVATAAHASPTADAISISWGGPEDSWTAQARSAFADALADAAALGVTVTAAAGDNGSSDGESGSQAHVDFPASSPHALACGGTSLIADAATGTVTSETVWNNGNGGGATGGGVSAVFPQPTWQASATSPIAGRGVPDTAGNADPQTGYQVLVDGTTMVIGGTSAVAPLWAALVARLNQATGTPLGLAQPAFYQQTQPAATPPGFRDITTGTNGAYTAGPGWDACTGLGVPNGAALLSRLTSPVHSSPVGGKGTTSPASTTR
jgi:kumamolisin